MGHSTDWAARFAALADELKAHPHLDVQNCEIGPPRSQTDLARDEKNYGVEVSPEVKSFYRQVDGVDILWIAAPEAHPGVEPDTFLPDISGRIFIPPYGEIIHDRWGDFLWHQDPSDDDDDDDDDEPDCCDDIRPFNFYDRHQGSNEAICLEMTQIAVANAHGHGGLSRLHCDAGVQQGGQTMTTGRFLWNKKPLDLSAYVDLLLRYRGLRHWHLDEPWSDRAIAAIFGR